MATFTAEQVAAGQAVYSKRVLSAYDLVVLGVSNRWILEVPNAAAARALPGAYHGQSPRCGYRDWVLPR